MSAGLRNQRVKIYAYTDNGADGVPSALYTFTAERWGRLISAAGRELRVGGKAEQLADAIIVLSDEAVFDGNALLQVGGVNYLVRATSALPFTREVEAICQLADDDVFTAELLADGTFIANGTQAATGAQSALVGG